MAGSSTAGKLPGMVPEDLRGLAGRLVICTYGEVETDATPQEQETVFVRGSGYQDMEDNDIRGFLDGTFLWAWNQPSQNHVRVGRVDPFKFAGEPKRGEHELFRVLMRWDGLTLPPRSEVLDASLHLTVERGVKEPLRVYLYEVIRDWDPGSGGIHRDNTSPPAQGEVWWNEVSHEGARWGLPGCSFASSGHPQADTGAMPLAESLYLPGDPHLVFSSLELRSCVERCVGERQPLRLLIKLADYQEDVPGAQLELYSANFGDDRQAERRPRLHVRWRGRSESSAKVRDVSLEYGRSLKLDPVDLAGPGWVAASFESHGPDSGLTVEYRILDGAPEPDWAPYSIPVRVESGPVQFRVSGASQAVALCAEFHTSIQNTWVVAQHPEEAGVVWMFESPTGRLSEQQGAYEGDYRWSARFVPREVGRWSYRWRQAFNDIEYLSPATTFDVVARDMTSVMDAIRSLIEEIESHDSGAVIDKHLLRVRLSRLIRGGTMLLTPGDFTGEPGQRFRTLCDEAREAMTGKPIVRPLPLEAYPRRAGEASRGAPGKRSRVLGAMERFVSRALVRLGFQDAPGDSRRGS